jgi:ribonuclease HIII
MPTNSSLAAQASSAAKAKLIRNHQEEYNNLLASERAVRNLPATLYSDPVTKLEQKLEKLKAQQAAIEKELAAQGSTQ